MKIIIIYTVLYTYDTSFVRLMLYEKLVKSIRSELAKANELSTYNELNQAVRSPCTEWTTRLH